MRSRILTGAALAVVVIVTILLLDTLVAALVFGVFWGLGAGEWAGLARLHVTGRLAYAGVFAAVCLAVLLFEPPFLLIGGWLLAAFLVWVVAFVCVLRYPLQLSSGLVLGAGLIVLPAAWLAFYSLHRVEGIGPGLILTGLLIVWSADVGAFFVGRSLGRHALAPRVSPKKTWEGVFGGVAFALVTAALAAWMLGLPPARLIGLALIAAPVSVVGDLGISMLKRRVGLKDSGVLLPGHGGILDRFDGVTAALPVFVLGLQFAHVLD